MTSSSARNIVSFEDRATARTVKPHNDLLVIELTIQDIDVARVLVDTGCSANIIYKSTLERMGVDLSVLTDDPSPVLGLSGEIMTLGSTNLLVRAGSVAKNTEFLVIDGPTSYNAIVGTPWLNSMRAIPSTFHLCLKFPTPFGVETIHGSHGAAQIYLATELKRKNSEIETSRKKQTVNNSPETFWQSQRAEALEGKREPTCEPVVSICLDDSSKPRSCPKPSHAGS
ncbi:hypothetical protein Bca4012_083540 [Brassica carinata]